jgi:hypothetical protein
MAATTSRRPQPDGAKHTGGTFSRPRLIRLIDPLDIAGHTIRAVLPSQATPTVAHLAYYAVLGGLAAAELVEPPVALLIAAGHLLSQSKGPATREIGDALSDA